MKPIDIIRSTLIPGSPEIVFPYVLMVELPLIFKRMMAKALGILRAAKAPRAG